MAEVLEARRLLTMYAWVEPPGSVEVPVGEGGQFTFNLHLYRDGGSPFPTISWQVSGQGASEGEDYTVSPASSGTVEIPDPDYPDHYVQGVTVQVLPDNLVEDAPERFRIDITAAEPGCILRPYGAPPWVPLPPQTYGLAMIIDSPASVSLARYSGSEGADGTEADEAATGEPKPLRFTLSRAGGDTSAPLAVSLTRDGSSTADGGDCTVPGSADFAAGETSKTILLPVSDDSEAEWTETLVLRVQSDPEHFSISGTGTASATIKDNDSGLLFQGLPEETEPSPHELAPGGYLGLNAPPEPISVTVPAALPPGSVAARALFTTGGGLGLWLDAEMTIPLIVGGSGYALGDVPSTLYVQGAGPIATNVTMTLQAQSSSGTWSNKSSDRVNITLVGIICSVSTPVFVNNASRSASACMEETDLRWHVTVQVLPSGGQAQVQLVLSNGEGTSGQTTNGAIDVEGAFGKVPDGDEDHHYTGRAWVEATFNGVTVRSAEVNTEVWELWITQFADTTTGKPWKVCVGDNISYAAVGSPDLVGWLWTMPEGTWNLRATGADPEAFGRTGTAYIPYEDEITATNDDFGPAHGTVQVMVIDANGETYWCDSTEDDGRKAQVFFNPTLGTDGNAASQDNPPAWFVFWNPIAGNPQVTYQHNLASAGLTDWETDFFGNLTAVSPPVVGPGAILTTSYGAGATFLDPATGTRATLQPASAPYGVSCWGIDAFHLTVMHEMLHYNDLMACRNAGGDEGPDGDFLITETVGGTPSPWNGQTWAHLANSWSLDTGLGGSKNNDREFRAFWHEAFVWCFDLGAYDSRDWSKGGKQW